MNVIMLQNLKEMLLERRYNKVITLPHEKVTITSLRALKPFVDAKEEEPIWKPQDVCERFYPPYCVQNLRAVMLALSEDLGHLVAIFCGLESRDPDNKLCKNTLEIIVEEIKCCDLKISTVLLLYVKNITSQARDFLSMCKSCFEFQTLPVEFTRQNLLTHVKMPDIQLISIPQYLQEKQVPIEKIPKIWQSDALCKYFGGRVNEILKSGQNTMNGYKYNYRLIVKEKKDKKVSKVIKKEK